MFVKLLFILFSTKLILAKPFLDYFREKKVVGVNYLDFAMDIATFTYSSSPLGNIPQDEAIEKCAKICVLDDASCFYFAVKQENEDLICEAFGEHFPFPSMPSSSSTITPSSMTIYKMSQEPAILTAYFRENIASKSLEELTKHLSRRYEFVDAMSWTDYTSFVSFLLRGTKDAILHRRIPQVANFDTFTSVTQIKSHPISQAEIKSRKTLFTEALDKDSFPSQPFMLDFIHIFCQNQGDLQTVYDQTDNLLFIYGSEKEKCFFIKEMTNNRFIIVQHNPKTSQPVSKSGVLNNWENQVAVESYLLAMEQAGMKTTESETEVMIVGYPHLVPGLLVGRLMGLFQDGIIECRDVADVVSATMEAMLYTAYTQNINTTPLQSRLFQSLKGFSDVNVIV